MNDVNVNMRAFTPRVEPKTTSMSRPINQEVNIPTDIGSASIQYIKNNCVHSGEKTPNGNVLIVKIIDSSNVNKIVTNLFTSVLFWDIVPYYN